MYKLKRLLAFSVARRRWSEVESNAHTFAKLYQLYGEPVAVLTDDQNPDKEYALAFNSLPAGMRSVQMSIPQWLDVVKNKPLPLSAEIPSTTVAYLRGVDAWQWGFDCVPTKADAAPGTDLLPDQCVDLRLTKPNVDYRALFKNALFTVNGLVHRHDADDNGLYIYQGGVSERIANDNQVGILDFYALGEVTTHSFDINNLTYPTPDLPLAQTTYYDLKEAPGNRTLGLVIGGYLHICDPTTFTYVSDTVIRIDFSNFPLLSRYYESKQYIDTTSLPITVYDSRPETVSVAELLSDAYIKAYLKLPQSFYFWIDSVGLQRTQHAMDHTNLPGVYTSYLFPFLPMQLGYGRTPEYNIHAEDGRYTCTVTGYFTEHAVRETYDWKSSAAVTSYSVPYNARQYAQPTFLELSKVVDPNALPTLVQVTTLGELVYPVPTIPA